MPDLGDYQKNRAGGMNGGNSTPKFNNSSGGNNNKNNNNNNKNNNNDDDKKKNNDGQDKNKSNDTSNKGGSGEDNTNDKSDSQNGGQDGGDQKGLHPGQTANPIKNSLGIGNKSRGMMTPQQRMLAKLRNALKWARRLQNTIGFGAWAAAVRFFGQMMASLFMLLQGILQSTIGVIISTLVSVFSTIGGAIAGAFGALSSVVTASVLITAGILIFVVMGGFSSNNDVVDDSTGVNCKTEQSVQAGNVSGVTGAWTEKGTKSYNIAKQIFEYAVNQAHLDAVHAAAMVGNAAEESGYFPNLKPLQDGGKTGTGIGLFQFTIGSNVPSDMSVEGQSAAILKNGLHGATLDSYKNTKGSIDDITEAFRSDFEGGDQNTARQDSARKAYEMFSSLAKNTSDANDAAEGNDSTAANENAKDNGCGNNTGDDTPGDSSSIVKYALSLAGKVPYAWNGTSPSHGDGYYKIGEGEKPDGYKTDCSGFVWGVLKHTGFKVDSNVWDTSAMVKSPNLKRISADETKPGDIQVCNSGGDPHTVILLEKYHGPSTKVVDEDGGQPNNVKSWTFADAYYGIDTSGQQFFRAIKK